MVFKCITLYDVEVNPKNYKAQGKNLIVPLELLMTLFIETRELLAELSAEIDNDSEGSNGGCVAKC